MSIKLTDTQVALLSAASQREDHCLTPQTGARSGPARKAAARLLEAGLVKEARARKDAPVWRRDEDSGQAFSLRLTAAGLKAIAAKSGAAVDEDRAAPARNEDAAREAAGADEAAGREGTHTEAAAADAGPEGGPSRTDGSPRAPRAGSKMADVIARLEREAGATVGELCDATGWLPHTTRAALTGLRKRGYALVSDRSDRMRGTVYRIARAEAGEAPRRDHRRRFRACGTGTSHDAAVAVPAGADPEKPAEAARARRKGRGASARTRRAA